MGFVESFEGKEKNGLRAMTIIDQTTKVSRNNVVERTSTNNLEN